MSRSPRPPAAPPLRVARAGGASPSMTIETPTLNQPMATRTQKADKGTGH